MSQVQLKAYAKVDATCGCSKSHPGLPVLVRVVAPPGMAERVPVDLVAVLDVSCWDLAPANTMDLLKRAMEHVIEKLSNQDRLAVVSVQTPAVPWIDEVAVEARRDYLDHLMKQWQEAPKQEAPKQEALAGLLGLLGLTRALLDDLMEKMRSPIIGIDDLRDMKAEGRTRATSTVQSLAVRARGRKLSRALKKAVGILEGRTAQERQDRSGIIILISDGDYDSSIFQETMNHTYSVHAFGFRDAHNARAMHYIANSSPAGTYGILNDEHDRITNTFRVTVENITSVVAVGTEVDIVCSDSSTATLSAIESGRFKSHIQDNRKSGHVSANGLQAGAVRNFIIYVDNVGEDEYKKLPRLLSVQVKYQHRPTDAASWVPETLDGQVAVVSKCKIQSKEVAAEIVRVEAVRIVGKILDKYKDNVNGLVDDVDELHQQWLRLKYSDYGREASAASLISGLATEMQEMEASMRRCSGLPYMLSWHIGHMLQHQTRAVSTPSKPGICAVWKICAVCFCAN